MVDDIVAARKEFAARGVEITEVRHFENGEWLEGKGGDWNAFAFFDDPNGNGWACRSDPHPSDERRTAASIGRRPLRSRAGELEIHKTPEGCTARRRSPTSAASSPISVTPRSRPPK